MSSEFDSPITPPPAKKKNTGLIIAIVIIVVLCCCCVGIAGLIYAFGGDIYDNIMYELGLYLISPFLILF